MYKVFIDTSAWISYSLSRQPQHSTIKDLIKQLIKNNALIYTSNDIVDETITRLLYDTDIKITKKFIDFLQTYIENRSLIQLWVDEEIQSEAFELVQKFAEHKLSLTDATTIALVKKFSIESVISLDSDFRKVNIKTRP